MDSYAPCTKRPNYIPQEFYKSVSQNISLSKKHCSTLNTALEGNKFLNSIELDRISYLSNLISDDLILKDFYVSNGENDKLLNGIVCLFDGLSWWHHDFKTSGRQDAAIARKLKDKLSECTVLLCASPDLRFNIQMRWEMHIRQIVDHGYKYELTPKGIEIKKMTKKLFSGSILQKLELENEGLIIPNSSVEISRYIDLLTAFIMLTEYLQEIEPQAAKKSSCVKKLHAEDAVVHYAVRKLKKLFEKHSVIKRKHIKYINDLINGVMHENTSENRIRKLVC